MSKEVLFLKEVESLVRVYGGNHWDWMSLPVPMRKWYIQRWNEIQEKQSKENQPSSDRPLTESERIKMINQAQKAQNRPPRPAEFMSPRRNIK